jgi:hypothetical protein
VFLLRLSSIETRELPRILARWPLFDVPSDYVFKRGRSTASEQVSLPEKRKALVERYMIDAEEAAARAARRAEERARREAEEQARREAEERARSEAEAQARREAEEQARRQAEEQARSEAEAQARRDAEGHARREAEELARREAQELTRREAAGQLARKPAADQDLARHWAEAAVQVAPEAERDAGEEKMQTPATASVNAHRRLGAEGQAGEGGASPSPGDSDPGETAEDLPVYRWFQRVVPAQPADADWPRDLVRAKEALSDQSSPHRN